MPKGPNIGAPRTRYRSMARAELVDATPAREHIAGLIDVGMTVRMIARGAGISDYPVRTLIAGTTRELRRPCSDALRSVTPRPHPQQAEVLPFGARRRIEALAVVGWSQQAVAEGAGILERTVQRIASGTTPRILWSTHAAIAAVYDGATISPTDGAARARARARRLGFIHPALWDDIDNLYEVPDLSMLRGPGACPDPELRERRIAAVAELTRTGLSETAIAGRLGVTARTVARDRAVMRRSA